MNRIKLFLKDNYYLATAVLLFLSFPSYDFAFLKLFPVIAWFSLVPLFCYVSGKPLKDVFFTAFVTGLAGNFLAYGWIGNFGAKVQGGFIVIIVFLIPTLTVFFTIKIILSEFLSQKFPEYKVFIYPAVWIIIDYVQSIGFLAFPWTYIGYSQYPFTSFIQIASVTGILGVNFIIILFNKAFSEYMLSFKNGFKSVKDILSNSYSIKFAVVLLLVIAITISGFFRLSSVTNKENGKKLKVVLIQSCISPWENWSGNRFRYLSELMHYTRESLATDPDFIIWSESATLELISFRAATGDRDGFDEQLLSFIKDNGKPLLTGEIGLTVRRDRGFFKYSPQNNAVLISGNGEVVQTYPKINLVPFGEWFPYEKWFAPVKRLLESFGASEFVPGKKPELFTVDGLRFGSLICYEGIFFRLCREYGNMGADFLVNITNDGWTDTYNGHYQHYSASLFRAVENGIWVARAGNTGVTSLIDPKGRVTASLPILKKNFLSGEIDTSRNVKTFYSRNGDLILYVSILFILIFIAIVVFRKFNIFLREKSAKK